MFKQSEAGRKLTSLLKDIGITAREYMIDYDYDLIPQPQKVDPRTGRVIKYKEPTMKERTEPEARLKERLLTSRPEIIIPMGNMGCKNLLGVASITKSRGVPTKVTISEDYEPWVLPMFSMEYLAMNPNIENLVQADLSTLKKFNEIGEEAFVAREVEYELVMSMERARQIFDFLYRFKPLTAWDLETNSLRAEMLGAKPLVMSMSWDEGQGVTVPLEHHESPWSKEELEELYELIRRFVADREQVKVGQNIQFDIRFLMGIRGWQEFWNHRDTLMGYYLVVVQKVESSKRLSDLAFELTDMGGYDKPLEDYKKQYKKDYIANKIAEIDLAKKEAKDKIEQDYKIAVAEYKQKLAEAKELGKSKKGIVAPKKEKMPKFPTRNSIKLVNEVDGGDFNYDWIPLDIIHPYASGDTDCCLRIHNELIKRIEPNARMYNLWVNFYPNLTRALAHVEATGILVDADYAKVIEEEYTKEEQRILEVLRKFPVVQQLEEEHIQLYQAGLAEWAKDKKDRDEEVAKLRDKYKDGKTVFNPSSASHKGRVLYKMLGITLPYDKESIKDKPFDAGVPESELTWEDYRTDKHALGYIAEYHPEAKELAETLLEYSKVNTLKNNFAIKLPTMVSNKDGKVHGSFLKHGTETSRLSAKNPNTQQIPSKVGDPKRFDYTYPIKRMFKTSFEKGALLQLDYSALEMRILALVAGDNAMTQAFFNGEDLHKATASILYDKPISEISKDERQSAKRVNFGLAYGKQTCRLVA